jgi:hypothetical protein
VQDAKLTGPEDDLDKLLGGITAASEVPELLKSKKGAKAASAGGEHGKWRWEG